MQLELDIEPEDKEEFKVESQDLETFVVVSSQDQTDEKIQIPSHRLDTDDDEGPLYDDRDDFDEKFSLDEQELPDNKEQFQSIDTKKCREKNYICDICQMRFATFSYIKKHILQKHLQIKKDQCTICHKRFYDTCALKRHINDVHLKKNPPIRQPCPDCGKAVTYLRSHRRRVHKIGKPIPPKLHKIMQIPLEARQKPYQCDICHSKFFNYFYMKKHILQKHLNLKKDKCLECDKEFYDTCALKRHIMYIHEKVPPKRDFCPVCGITVSRLVGHMKRVHRPDKVERASKQKYPKSQCELCLKMFSRKENMLEHRRRIHKEIIPKPKRQLRKGKNKDFN